mmetsp:Transcript_148/g.701  ORF Transcript_148/g.701 Transcript_148/m.701 type:complete len:250 (-) Transcript_148:483-1232(-)
MGSARATYVVVADAELLQRGMLLQGLLQLLGAEGAQPVLSQVQLLQLRVAGEGGDEQLEGDEVLPDSCGCEGQAGELRRTRQERGHGPGLGLRKRGEVQRDGIGPLLSVERHQRLVVRTDHELLHALHGATLLAPSAVDVARGQAMLHDGVNEAVHGDEAPSRVQPLRASDQENQACLHPRRQRPPTLLQIELAGARVQHRSWAEFLLTRLLNVMRQRTQQLKGCLLLLLSGIEHCLGIVILRSLLLRG